MIAPFQHRTKSRMFWRRKLAAPSFFVALISIATIWTCVYSGCRARPSASALPQFQWPPPKPSVEWTIKMEQAGSNLINWGICARPSALLRSIFRFSYFSVGVVEGGASLYFSPPRSLSQGKLLRWRRRHQALVPKLG